MKVKLRDYEIPVKIIYKNNQNIYFRFDSELNLVVTCPKRTYDEEIFNLIYSNEDALIKMYEKSVSKKKFDNEFWLLGKRYNVEFNEELNETQINGEYIYTKNQDMLNNYVNDLIEQTFTKEAELCSKCFASLPEYKLKFRKMKTRWGVCNRRDDSITLNTELIKRRVELLDYVIIHEMAHFYQGNHSKKFWDIVSQACPDYKERRKELKK